jgi:hypothetical protein
MKLAQEQMTVLSFGLISGRCPKCNTLNKNKDIVCCNCGESLYIDCPQRATISVEVPNGTR